MADFHRPAAPGDGDEVRHGRRPALGCPAQVEGELARAGEQPADQQELPRAAGGDQRPVADPRSLGPGAARAPLEDGVRGGGIRADHGAGRGRDLVVARDDEHVRQAGLPARLAQVTAAAVHLVGGHPGQRQARRQASHLLDRELRLGGELQVLGDPGRPAARQVIRPPLRHVHVEAGPGLPGGGDVGGEHAGHAVLHLPGAPGMLGSHARRGVPLLQVRGLIDRDPGPDQVAVGVCQPGSGQSRQLRPQVLPVPRIGPQQGLHPAPALMPGRLRQAPAVRPHPRRQRQHVRERYLHAAALRHHPVQDRHDLGICPRGARRDILYAGLRGRGIVLFRHKLKTESRPPQIADAQSRAEHPLNSVTHRQIRCGTAAQNLTQRSRTALLSALIVKQRL